MTNRIAARQLRVLESATRAKEAAVTVEMIDRLKGNDSRYGYLVRYYGQDFADRFMRNLEVASWDLRGLR